MNERKHAAKTISLDRHNFFLRSIWFYPVKSKSYRHTFFILDSLCFSSALLSHFSPSSWTRCSHEEAINIIDFGGAINHLGISIHIVSKISRFFSATFATAIGFIMIIATVFFSVLRPWQRLSFCGHAWLWPVFLSDSYSFVKG